MEIAGFSIISRFKRELFLVKDESIIRVTKKDPDETDITAAFREFLLFQAAKSPQVFTP